MKKSLKPCNYPMCPNLTRTSHCDDHAVDNNRHAIYDKHYRDKDATAFYNSKEWRRVRVQALTRDNHLCQHCLITRNITMADMVDHIKPLKNFWELKSDLRNLQSLCNACHGIKTVKDKRVYS